MRPLLSVDEMREWEASLIEAGVPGALLMENAGRGAAHILGLRGRPGHGVPRRPTSTRGSCIACADERSLRDVEYLIVCGPGNNGGDGYVVARHLLGRGAKLRVLAARPVDDLTGDARAAARALLAVGGTVERATSEAIASFGGACIVDALLGTGTRGAVTGELAELILAMNSAPAPKVALDVPSGFDADVGVVHHGAHGQVAVRAEHTIVFGHLKRGLLTTFGYEYAGRITLAHLGVPAEWRSVKPPSGWLLEASDIVAGLVPRSPTAHKGSAGEVAIVGGAPGMVGAAHLAARAALRAGAGLATIHAEYSAARELDGEVFEVMTRAYGTPHSGAIRLERKLAQALVLGPGLGRSQVAGDLYHAALHMGQESQIPIVLDADALRLSLGRMAMLRTVSESGVRLVLTPHPGEAAHLLEVSSAEVERDRFAAAQRLAQLSGAIVVLKGARTIVAAPGLVPRVSAFGSPALATAGSGDVLAGIVGSLLAQAYASGRAPAEVDAFLTVCAAVGLHGLCGELFEAERGSAGCLASDIVDLLPRARAELVGELAASTASITSTVG